MAAESPPLLQLSNIRKTFPSNKGNPAIEVLKGINLTAERGDYIVITGKSGSGKSTLLGIMTGLHKPTSGDIYFNGIKNVGYSDNGASTFRRNHMGFVFQGFNLIPYLTVLENIMAPLKFSDVPYSIHKQRAQGILEKLQIPDKANYYPNQLSGGQMQRVAIARALVREPEIIIADEPTGNLDKNTANNFMNILGELHESQGISFIIVTHSKLVLERAKKSYKLLGGVLEEDLEHQSSHLVD